MSRQQVEGVTGLPVGMPSLGPGKHSNPRQGACVMEYTALLAGERFSDQPRCTHPALGELARQVNDRLSHSGRPQLVTRAPALAMVGRGVPGVAAAVATAACEFALREVLGPWTVRGLRGRLARLQHRDQPGRSRRGRRRDTVTAHLLISAGLNATRAVPAGSARDRVLLRALDDALSTLGGAPGGTIEGLLLTRHQDRAPAS